MDTISDGADDLPVPLLHALLKSRIWPIILVVYVCTLATATHWPKLRIEGPVPRSDLYLHLIAFGTLGGLVTLSALFAPHASRRNLVQSWLAALLYAAVDESTQAIPGLGRTSAWDDYLANATGITLGVATAAILLKLTAPQAVPATPPIPAPTPQTPTDS